MGAGQCGPGTIERDMKAMSASDDLQAIPDLQGLRVFVVEDEAAITLLLEDMLLDFGCEVVGPASRIEAACEMARTNAIDLAILDVNIAGQTIAPVVEALSARAIPMVFSTGYGNGGLDESFRGSPVLEKPFTQADLERRMRTAITASRAAAT